MRTRTSKAMFQTTAHDAPHARTRARASSSETTQSVRTLKEARCAVFTVSAVPRDGLDAHRTRDVFGTHGRLDETRFSIVDLMLCDLRHAMCRCTSGSAIHAAGAVSLCWRHVRCFTKQTWRVDLFTNSFPVKLSLRVSKLRQISSLTRLQMPKYILHLSHMLAASARNAQLHGKRGQRSQ